MSETIKIKATDGSSVEFINEIIGSGGMKDVYFSPDKSYVVGFFRDPQDFNARRMLVENFKKYFTSEEMSKEMDRIDDAYTGKIDRSQNVS